MATTDLNIKIVPRRFYKVAFWLLMGPAVLLKWEWMQDKAVNCMYRFEVEVG